MIARSKLMAAVLTALAAFVPASAGAEDPAPRTPVNDIPRMHEEAMAAGIDHSYTGPWEFFVGGGGASLDCNGDRMPDIFLAGGKGASALYVNESQPGGELRFAQKPLDLDAKDLSNVLGAYALDIDNDGHRDLVLLRLGENIVLKGGPGCTFAKANRQMSLDGGRAWTTAFAATWEAEQTFPTLAFGNYVDRSAPGSPWGTCEDNVLARPQPGDKPDYSQPSALTPGYCALSMLFTDWNRSGHALACASPTTVNTIAAARSSSGRSIPALRQSSTARRMAGSICRSGEWALPKETSTAMARPNTR